jgi:hypothetical protein
MHAQYFLCAGLFLSLLNVITPYENPRKGHHDETHFMKCTEDIQPVQGSTASPK